MQLNVCDRFFGKSAAQSDCGKKLAGDNGCNNGDANDNGNRNIDANTKVSKGSSN